MNPVIATLLILLISIGGFFLAKRKIVVAGSEVERGRPYALPRYYGYCTGFWSFVPAIILFFILLSTIPTSNFTSWIALFASAGLAIIITFFASSKISPNFRARNHVEKWFRTIIFIFSVTSITVTIMIIASVVFESVRFFDKVPFTEFLFGTHWSPQTAMRADQAGSSGSFGAVPVFLGTLLITFIAMCVAAPLGLLSAIYLSEYASSRVRKWVKPLLEILAGVPTVVYGYFAAVTFAPFLRDMGDIANLTISSESALAAGIIMGVMIIPFVLSLSDDVISSVPNSLREASSGLGATKSETIRKVILPAALPGVMGAMLLATSRGIGETMIVVMAAGLAANLTFSPLESVTTVTAQIVTLLVGDQEFDSAKTLAAFALSLTLFVVTLLLNIISMVIVRKYSEQYD